MKTVIPPTNDMRVPIKMWLDDIETEALDQAVNLSKLPFVFHHIAIMPDSHLGYGVPIGGVMCTKGVIIPNAVGVDIGCGMLAEKTPFKDKELDTDTLKKIMSEIRKRVPVGFDHHTEKQEWEGFYHAPDIEVVQKELQSASHQLGTLGQGNHFLELQAGSDGFIWVMLHSGSRNFGLKIAKDYHEKAKKLCEKWYSDIPSQDLAFLPMDSIEGQEYEKAMNFALDFAKENRAMMVWGINEAIKEVTGVDIKEDFIDVHHNYAALENHFNSNVMVHRKGAIRVRKGEIGIIPGSQGTSSYIVEGLGNEDSFQSSSHGAGRKMSRTAAQKTLSLDDEKKKLDDKGIIHGIRGVKDLDEASGAYKDIDVVMENQKDLVKILVKLSPLAVIKG